MTKDCLTKIKERFGEKSIQDPSTHSILTHEMFQSNNDFTHLLFEDEEESDSEFESNILEFGPLDVGCEDYDDDGSGGSGMDDVYYQNWDLDVEWTTQNNLCPILLN